MTRLGWHGRREGRYQGGMPGATVYARPALTTSSPAALAGSAAGRPLLECRPIAFSEIPRPAWDRLLAVTPAATPFARWNVHRAWWDAYGGTAHEQYMVALEPGARGEPSPDGEEIRAIVPLMHRHEIELQDAATATTLRRTEHELPSTDVPGEAKAIFFGTAYHTDYATLLADPADLPAVAAALVAALAGPPDSDHGNQPWDVVDLRRLRSADPTLSALEAAFRAGAADHAWQVTREPEDVCPVVSAPSADWDEYLATLDKKARHEIRRKWRRAEGAGEISVSVDVPSDAGLERFIDLHQARFAQDGLFPDTEGGARSRRFVRRLAELERDDPDGGQLRLAEVRVGEAALFTALAFEDETTCFLYNAGMDPAASQLSPGVVGAAAYIRDRLGAGKRRFDFLRGDEPYKYEWGASDEVIERLLVVRA